MEVNNLNKWKRILILLFIFVLLFYFVNFYNTTILSQESSAQFGDYFGGVLNPFLGFATVALLVWSIQIQLRELKFTRDELELNTQANREQAIELKRQNNFVIQKENDNVQYSEFDKLQRLFLDQQVALSHLLDKPLGFLVDNEYITASDLLYKNNLTYQSSFESHILKKSTQLNFAKYQIAHSIYQCDWILGRMLERVYLPGFIDTIKTNLDWFLPFMSICYEKQLISKARAKEIYQLVDSNIKNCNFDDDVKSILKSILKSRADKLVAHDLL